MMNAESRAHNTRVVAISGATGFLGSALCRHLASHGYHVRGLVRNPASAPRGLEKLEWYCCSLPDRIDRAALEGVHTLIHCAYETKFVCASRSREVNVEGSNMLFESCRAAGVTRIAFISSMSAHDAAISAYGQTKLEVEAMLDPEWDIAIRPGLIIGEGGVFWRMAEMIRTMPFIPLFFGGRQSIQTIALPDVCKAIRLVLEKELTGIIKIATPKAVPIRELYRSIADRQNKRARFIPLPGLVALQAMRFLEGIRIPAPLSSDNLNGLRRMRTFDVTTDLERLGFQPRTTQESLALIRWSELSR